MHRRTDGPSTRVLTLALTTLPFVHASVRRRGRGRVEPPAFLLPLFTVTITQLDWTWRDESALCLRVTGVWRGALGLCVSLEWLNVGAVGGCEWRCIVFGLLARFGFLSVVSRRSLKEDKLRRMKKRGWKEPEAAQGVWFVVQSLNAGWEMSRGTRPRGKLEEEKKAGSSIECPNFVLLLHTSPFTLLACNRPSIILSLWELPNVGRWTKLKLS